MSQKEYIIKSFNHYKATGDLRPLLYDLRLLSCNICARHGCLNDFAHDQLWSHIMERIAVAIKHYDPKKGNPFQFFYGMIKKHVFYYACRKGRYPDAILFDSTMAGIPPFSQHLKDEIDEINDTHEAEDIVRKNSINNSNLIQAFMAQVTEAINEGEDILHVRQRMIKHRKLNEKDVEQIDLKIVMMRKMQWKTLNI